jgi:hypothetical protein
MKANDGSDDAMFKEIKECSITIDWELGKN